MHDPWALLSKGASLRTRLMALSFAALVPGFCVIGFTEYQVHKSRQAEVGNSRSAVPAKRPSNSTG